MFGLDELQQIRREIEDAIYDAEKATKIWHEKRNEIVKLIGEKNTNKIGEILEL